MNIKAMIKHIFYLIALAVGLIFARTVGATEPMQMTMTLKPDGEVVLIMAGSGTVTIDWGERSPSETHTLWVYDKEEWQNNWRKYAYIRAYSRKSARTITITGENITHLECNRLELTSLDVTKNAVLTNLNCSGNQLTSLDVSNNTALTDLRCGNNKLTSLDVSNNNAITYLDCWNNQITSLDVRKNIVLEILYCSANLLTDLDVSNNAALTELYCGNNKLTSLDISNNTALTDLRCWNTHLTSLDVSNNTALTYLDCWNNQITRLDVRKNTALKELYCGANLLTDLDVSNNTALINLFCFDNQLTYFGVNSNTALTRLDCHNNRLSSFALNALFLTLHSDTIPEEKRICIRNNPGIDACDQRIATHKGWMVICPVSPVQNVQSEVDTTMVTVDPGNTRPLFSGKDPEESFRNYIMHKTVYPQSAQNSGIQGIVLVEFSINRQGKVVDVQVLQSVHPLLDAEALRVVRSSPKWTPGMQRGKKVKVKYIFPFAFKL